MLEELRNRMAAYLSAHRAAVLSTAGAPGAWAMPVRYRSRGLEVDCLLPRWADAAYHLEQNPQVLLVISDEPQPGGGTRMAGLAANPQSATLRLHSGQVCHPQFPERWLQYRGLARPVASPDWSEWLPQETSPALAERLYLVIHLTPERMDLIDESLGWGARETLEM